MSQSKLTISISKEARQKLDRIAKKLSTKTTLLVKMKIVELIKEHEEALNE